LEQDVIASLRMYFGGARREDEWRRENSKEQRRR
jgi:hypothetical protein